MKNSKKDKNKNFEQEINKVLKYNLDISESLLNDEDMSQIRAEADNSIASSIELIKSMGYGDELSKINISEDIKNKISPDYHQKEKSWEDLVKQAEEHSPENVYIEDILSEEELNGAYRELKDIEAEFSKKTSIFNKIDRSFLFIAAGLQVAKSLIFPYISQSFGYGNSFEQKDRLDHNDINIEKNIREAKNDFRDKHLANNKAAHWINILYQTPPYDITRGSSELGINMGGRYHRLATLGHDPLFGWLFGTMNILTDTITFSDISTHRVTRNPLIITDETVDIFTLIKESYQAVKDDWLNLPAAIFAQAQHLKSDINTKTGLPLPVLTVFNENLANKLYREHYDYLCFARDAKIIGTSFIISQMIDMIIALVHSLYRQEDCAENLYAVRTKKILLISNTIASTSTIINAVVSKNIKNLDIGMLLSTLSHLFFDIRFIRKIKQEFIDSEIQNKLQGEIDKLDELYNRLMCD